MPPNIKQTPGIFSIQFIRIIHSVKVLIRKNDKNETNYSFEHYFRALITCSYHIMYARFIYLFICMIGILLRAQVNFTYSLTLTEMHGSDDILPAD